MKILVCIKQVPGTTQAEIDETTGTLKRDGVPAKMNPFDLYALETALRIKAEIGAEVTAMTMGPPQCESVVRETLSPEIGAHMRGIKAAFDPKNILNPGKVVPCE